MSSLHLARRVDLGLVLNQQSHDSGVAVTGSCNESSDPVLPCAEERLRWGPGQGALGSGAIRLAGSGRTCQCGDGGAEIGMGRMS